MRNTDLDFFSGKNQSGLALGLTWKRSIQSLVVATMAGCGSAPSEASDEVFNEAYRVSSGGNAALLDQYQYAMQDSVLAYYPEYWKLNQNLVLQPSSAIISFSRRYPQSAMAEKLSADYVEEKVRAGDFASAAPVLS